jgi:radical SAM-linked protein
VGFSGRSEVLDVALEQWVRPDAFRERLAGELPPGLRLSSAEAIAPGADRQPREVTYRVPLRAGHRLSEDAIDDLLAAEHLTVERELKEGTRPVDVRQFVKALRLAGRSLHMVLTWSPTGTARPQEVLQALGCTEGVDYRLGELERTRVSLST